MKTISSRLIRHPFSLVIFKDLLFVTDWRLDAIIQMNKTTGGNEVIVEKVEESNRLYGIKIFSMASQQIVPNHPCHSDNGGCEKLCFPVPAKSNQTSLPVASCGCPTGEKLQADGKSCTSDPTADPPAPGLPQRLGLHLRQSALHPQDLDVRRRRRLPGQQRRAGQLHPAHVRDRRVEVRLRALHTQVLQV